MAPPSETTLRLWISRTRGTLSAAAWARSRSAASCASGSTCTTTSLPGSARSSSASTRSATAWPWPTAAPGGTEMTTSANVRPAACRSRSRDSSTGGSIRAIAARAASSASAGALSISTSTLRRISRAAATSTRPATKSAAIESPSGKPAVAATSPAEHGERADEVAAEVERVREQRLAPIAPRRSQRDDASRPRSIASTSADDGEDPPGRVDTLPAAPERRVTASAATATLTRREHRRLDEGGEMLSLAVAVLVPLVGRANGDADREERQQRGDEVGARVQRLRDEPEAAAREARAELQRNEGPAAPIETSAVRRCGVMRRRLADAQYQRPRRKPPNARPRIIRISPEHVAGQSSTMPMTTRIAPIPMARLSHTLVGRQTRYRLPRSACSRSIDSKSALKLPSPNVVAPCRSITSKKSVGRSCAVFVKICSR